MNDDLKDRLGIRTDIPEKPTLRKTGVGLAFVGVAIGWWALRVPTSTAAEVASWVGMLIGVAGFVCYLIAVPHRWRRKKKA